jgi:energy-coupling factor transporter ATP-binding protein EcfA2
VIKSVTIKNLRGIREGELSELTPLVVLVGPNSSGKSTILDALLIGASPMPGKSMGIAVSRRNVQRGARWLLWRSGEFGATEIGVTTKEGEARTCQISLHQADKNLLLVSATTNTRSAILTGSDHGTIGPNNVIGSGGGVGPLSDVPEVRLIEPQGSKSSQSLHGLYSLAVQRGRRNEVTAMIAGLVPGVTGIEILTDENDPVVHLVFPDHSVPAGLAGDGIQSLLRLSLELATQRGGVALLEEPEVHEHPGAIRQSARAIVTAVRRGVQVILSTHSLELIDALLAELKDEELPWLSLYRLKLTDGVLAKSRLEGPSVLRSRGEIGDDLR